MLLFSRATKCVATAEKATGFCLKSRSPYSRVSQQTAVSGISTYCLQCDYTLNHFYCCKILIFILKLNNQLRALSRRAGASRAEPGGFVRADCEPCTRTLCVDSTCSPIQSPSQGAVLDEFISGALGGRGRVCSPLPHIHGSVRRHCRVMITHTSPNDQGGQSWVYPQHRRQRFTLCSVSDPSGV